MIDYNLLAQALPQLIIAAGKTLAIAFLSASIGFIGGTIIALLQMNANKLLNAFLMLYVTIIRGTPMLLQIMFMYIMLPQLGINISSFATAVLAIGLNSCAYISQVIRSGIKSVDKGQIEAAKCLGIKKFDLICHIILPQAFIVTIPVLLNELITLIKDSSLASLLGVIELFKRGEIIISYTHDAILIYLCIGLIYLILTSSLTLLVNSIETRINNYVGN